MNANFAVVIHDDVKLNYKIFYEFETKEEAEACYKAHKRRDEPAKLIEYKVKKSKFKAKGA